MIDNNPSHGDNLILLLLWPCLPTYVCSCYQLRDAKTDTSHKFYIYKGDGIPSKTRDLNCYELVWRILQNSYLKKHFYQLNTSPSPQKFVRRRQNQQVREVSDLAYETGNELITLLRDHLMGCSLENLESCSWTYTRKLIGKIRQAQHMFNQAAKRYYYLHDTHEHQSISRWRNSGSLKLSM